METYGPPPSLLHYRTLNTMPSRKQDKPSGVKYIECVVCGASVWGKTWPVVSDVPHTEGCGIAIHESLAESALQGT